MKWLEAKVIFEFDDKEFAIDLISNIFYDFGVQGVVVEDPGLEPEEDWGDDAQMTPEHYAVIGYFRRNKQAKEKKEVLQKELVRLKKENGIISRIAFQEIDEKDWAESWKEHFWPEKISRNIVVKPTWREYDSNPNEIIIEIDPGMAFGTGTHPTTSLCIHMIEKYLKPGDSFLDVGTGSGILMIAAAKLGAEKLFGIDKSDGAVEITQKNLWLNNIETHRFKVKTGNLVEGVEERFDLVVANILMEVIVVLLDDIQRVLAESGIFICSGMIEGNTHLVVGKMKALGLEIIETLTKDKWVSIAGRPNPVKPEPKRFFKLHYGFY
jgi:ribosomal protein L11 methyltransferase